MPYAIGSSDPNDPRNLPQVASVLFQCQECWGLAASWKGQWSACRPPAVRLVAQASDWDYQHAVGTLICYLGSRKHHQELRLLHPLGVDPCLQGQ